MIASERRVADVLDALHIEWEYEPRMFVLSTNGDGHCSEGFRPDFYLPRYDLYIEVTLAKVQTIKNRKIRKLLEQYGVRCELVCRYDFQDLTTRLRDILAIEYAT